MVNINLEFIKKYFPQLKRFIARLRKNEIELIKDKRKVNVNTDLVMECVSNIWTIVAFGEAHNKFDIEISNESLEEMVEWLGCQNIKDTTILLDRLNMIDREDYVDKALSELYGCLIDSLEEE